MRDFHKVQEQHGVLLSAFQIYVLVGLSCLALGLIFVLGFRLGQEEPSPLAGAEPPLVPEEVQNETVAMLLARAAAEEETQAAEQARLELHFSQILPARTGEEAEAPTVARGVRSPVDALSGKAVTPAASVSSGSPLAGRTEESAAPAASTGGGGSTHSLAPVGTDGTASRGEASSPPETSAVAGTAPLPHADSSPSLASGGGSSRVAPAGDAAAGVGASGAQTAGAPARPSIRPPTPDEERTGSGRGGFTVQVSSYQEPGMADRLVRQLGAQGFDSYRVEAEINGNVWYRVRVGSFESRDGAERELQRLKAARSELDPMIAHR